MTLDELDKLEAGITFCRDNLQYFPISTATTLKLIAEIRRHQFELNSLGQRIEILHEQLEAAKAALIDCIEVTGGYTGGEPQWYLNKNYPCETTKK